MVMPDVIFSGPLWSSQRDKIIRDGLRDIERDVAKQGEKLVKSELRPGHGVATGRFRSSITGDVVNSRHGLVTHRDSDGKAAWLEGTASTNRTSRFKGYHMFVLGRRRLDRIAERTARPAAKRLMRRLN